MIFQIKCSEPEGEFVRTVNELILTPTNCYKFYQKASQFPYLYGKRILGGPQEFINLFLHAESNGNLVSTGLFWVVDDFVGVFHLTDIRPMEDALVHYSFFDRRHKGRVPLVRAMLRYLFDTYKFQRLSAEVPAYAGRVTKHFASQVGFTYEGLRRKAAPYKDDWFDVHCFGILKNEV